MRLISVWIFLLYVLFSTQAFGQIYKYVDQDGHFWFTDNTERISETFLESMNTIQEIKSNNRQYPMEMEKSNDQVYTPPQSLAAFQDINPQADEHSLVLEGDELHKLYEQIETDKNNLNPPPESASRMERRVYQQQVIDLNLRIEDYQTRVEAYREKVEAYNQRIENTNQ